MTGKYFIVPASVALHARMKYRAKQEGRPMTKIIRGLIEEYLEIPPDPPSFQEALAREIKEKVA
jgi:predicted DNA-binding protein